MKRDILICLIIFFNLCFDNSIDAQNIMLHQTKESGNYAKGEKIKMTVFLKNSQNDTVTIKVRKNFTNLPIQFKKLFVGDTLTVFEETYEEPTTVILEIIAKKDTASIGCIVDAIHYQPGTNRPIDFDEFWDSEKRALRSLSMIVEANPIQQIEDNFRVFNVEINCTSAQPVRGYFAKPSTSQPHSLPIVIYFHAAGVSGSWCRSEPGIALRYAKMGNGALSFDLNAHGMLNGQPDEYYNDLEKGSLKGYATYGVENKKEFYFRGMYLRLIRTIDFLTAQPEWDGKRILVVGESQGGGQSLAAAGLDHRVSAAVVTVPAMCDWGGSLVGRKGSYPYPFETKYDQTKMLETMPYFDIAHILKGSTATIVAEIGLLDNTCPSSAVYAAINQSKGKKILFTVPYRAHHLTQLDYKKVWEEKVSRPKEAFIKDYLK